LGTTPWNEICGSPNLPQQTQKLHFLAAQEETSSNIKKQASRQLRNVGKANVMFHHYQRQNHGD